MKFNEKKLEIILRISPNGDFSVESNTRENIRVFRGIQHVSRQLAKAMNDRDPRIMLPSGHKDFMELTKA